MAMPRTASANNYAESLAWQFRTTNDQVNQAAILDIIQKHRGGYYAAPSYTTNIARQVNCSITATSTGNSGSQTALANAPTVTGATSTATGNANATSAGDGRSGAAIDSAQGNSGAVSSGVAGDTSVTVHGNAQQSLNSTETNSGNQTASVLDSDACAFGALN
jgi:uncharacterized protein YyaL (SSP411 family)